MQTSNKFTIIAHENSIMVHLKNPYETKEIDQHYCSFLVKTNNYFLEKDVLLGSNMDKLEQGEMLMKFNMDGNALEHIKVYFESKYIDAQFDESATSLAHVYEAITDNLSISPCKGFINYQSYEKGKELLYAVNNGDDKAFVDNKILFQQEVLHNKYSNHDKSIEEFTKGELIRRIDKFQNYLNANLTQCHLIDKDDKTATLEIPGNIMDAAEFSLQFTDKDIHNNNIELEEDLEKKAIQLLLPLQASILFDLQRFLVNNGLNLDVTKGPKAYQALQNTLNLHVPSVKATKNNEICI